jgi:hypothetical protein
VGNQIDAVNMIGGRGERRRCDVALERIGFMAEFGDD